MKSIMQLVREKVKQTPPGQLLTYADFKLKDSHFEALAAALSRLAKQGMLERLGRGRYYKPKETIFGNIQPTEKVLIDKLKVSGSKVKGYESGIGLYNQLGLTTQVAQEVTLMTKKQRRTARFGKTKVRFMQSPTDFKAPDIDKLQLLDALRDFKKIPDRNSAQIIAILRKHLTALTEREQKRLVQLALDYNPATRALLGALLAQLGQLEKAIKLKQSLNPLTSYKLGIPEAVLPNAKDWNIR
ncbi:DUF6088 family protein [Pontibacter pudoricolor]|uniref:DUF6088 family protein n=1 Tax=Pontibacter pudoricolor TaxID=2694930 RepID=UPI0013911674|nr:DUF6088 family protein [Pontibacter pudoricolor]